MIETSLKAPFPWFGGKSRAARMIWQALGDVPNYVEPFFGSGAILLGRPSEPRIETVNDKDGFVANAWRAIQLDPMGTAHWADQPVNENDLHARHVWLREKREMLSRRLEGDPTYYDVQIAGWWLWGMACWIGSGFCGPSGAGPWTVQNGQLLRSDAGRGVRRQCVHLGNAGQGVCRYVEDLASWFLALQNRLRRVRICCGDWMRTLGPTPTTNLGLTGIVLDPPYASAERDPGCYNEDSDGLSARVAMWARDHGDDPNFRIVLCGYEGEHNMPRWTVVHWKASGGYGNQGTGRAAQNRSRERIWCSPSCLSSISQPGLI